jgi:hypothetical protein
MTEQQFKDLKIGDKVTHESNEYEVTNTYPLQRIIMGKGILNISTPFRYEDVEVLVKDELVEYLKLHDRVIDYDEYVKQIRSIVRKEVIDGLKFPNREHFNYRQAISRFDWFVEETKRLNS